MPDSRAAILAALHAARLPETAPPPAYEPTSPGGDLLDALDASLTAAGAVLVRWPRARLAAALEAIPGFAAASQVWSALPEVKTRGVSAQASEARELASLEFALVPGELVVAESGAVWNVPRPLDRAAMLLCEHLVLVVPAAAVVATLHEAYARIDPAPGGFGWFVAGPSKTADIEQTLVLGAHGPRDATLLLLDD